MSRIGRKVILLKEVKNKKKQLEKISFWSSVAAVGAVIAGSATEVAEFFTVAGILAVISFATLILKKLKK